MVNVLVGIRPQVHPPDQRNGRRHAGKKEVISTCFLFSRIHSCRHNHRHHLIVFQFQVNIILSLYAFVIIL